MDKETLCKLFLIQGNCNCYILPKILLSLPAHSVKEKFPAAENICNEIFSLPIWPGITQDQIDYIVLSIEEYFNS